MKNFLTIVLSVFVLHFLAVSAMAQPYFSGSIGIVSLMDSDFNAGADTGEISYDAGVGLLAAVGGRVSDNLRFEGEIGYRANDLDKGTIDGLGTAKINGDITALSLMGNMYVDFMPHEFFSPFVGFGLGFANVELDFDGAGSEDDDVFAYQVAIGGTYAANKQVSLDVQYRYFATDDPDFEGLESEYQSHNVLVGLRFNF
ncbi:MAG: porin family protein [Desulfuromonadales bacterium]|nr:porin family protein [Desulfuromonadales bacterium]MDW7758939.1 porin family protein [Desulfuromonadales bacterium]